MMGIKRGGGSLVAAVMVAVAVGPAQADDPAPVPSGQAAPASLDPKSLDQKELQLRGLQESIEAAAARRAALSTEIAGLQADHAKLAAALIETTATVNQDQARAADTEKRLDALTTREDDAKRSLEGRRAVVAEVLAALQRMGRKPPPALLVDPDDVLKAIRTSMLLGAVLPGMRAEMERLIVDLEELTRTRRSIEAERQSLDAELESLAAERERMTALIDARQAALGKAQGEMQGAADTAARLADQAGSLKDLIGRMERDNAAAARAAEAARQSDAKLAAMAPDTAVAAAPFKDPARLRRRSPSRRREGCCRSRSRVRC